MPAAETQASALLRGDRTIADRLATTLLRPLSTNFVERPWGGMEIRRFKGLCALRDQVAVSGLGLGEAFEVAAYNDDEEARAHPSLLRLDDDSLISLAELLHAHGDAILGADFVARHGACFPLLPKILDISELLSVQGHPAGHTEVYVIIAAEPEATIRLGFNADVDAGELTAQLESGLRAQHALLALLRAGSDQHELQGLLQPWLARRSAPSAALVETLAARGMLEQSRRLALGRLAEELKGSYWRMLDRLNAIPVAAGQVIHNANPERRLAPGCPASAEVHALGNPEGREVLALEIRKPGPTFRAWDNVRFPMREVDVRAAVGALNLRRTTAADFIATPEPVPGCPGVSRSVDSEHFRVEHLGPTAREPVSVAAQAPHSLHVLAGGIVVRDAAGRELGSMRRGESALVPRGVGAYHVMAIEAPGLEAPSLDEPGLNEPRLDEPDQGAPGERGAAAQVIKASVPDAG